MSGLIDIWRSRIHYQLLVESRAWLNLILVSHPQMDLKCKDTIIALAWTFPSCFGQFFKLWSPKCLGYLAEEGASSIVIQIFGFTCIISFSPFNSFELNIFNLCFIGENTETQKTTFIGPKLQGKHEISTWTLQSFLKTVLPWNQFSLQ